MKEIKRRTFIRNTLLTGVGASLAGPEILRAQEAATSTAAGPENSRRSGGERKKVVVAGAGIAGLCCAYELMKKGHDVVVLEASPRHGGHVFTGFDGLSDGLYADLGAEHITKPGYEEYWEYTREFNLTVLPYPRRINQLRRIDGKFYSEEMLHDPAVLRGFGFNEREVKYLSENPWWDLESLFLKPYLHKFKDEYQPYGVGYDHLDTVPIAEIFKKEKASAAALRFLGGEDISALYELWRLAIYNFRNIPLSSPNVFRLQGGNQQLPNAFAKRLGDRIRLNCPILSIRQDEGGVTITYREFGEEKEMRADYLANCIPAPAFKTIPVSPPLSEEKRYAIDNVAYNSYSRFIFQARSKFWEEDGTGTINIHLGHPDIWFIWQVAEEVDTHRVILLANGPGGVSAARALAGFREVYPGKRDTIEYATVQDWTKAQFSSTCERVKFPMGELHRFWPHVMTAEGRIHFAGAYADNLNRGQEAATRSAIRVAREIDEA